jgi:hypothetical protein
MRVGMRPQGLKPGCFCERCGTTEVAPCYRTGASRARRRRTNVRARGRIVLDAMRGAVSQPCAIKLRKVGRPAD